MEEISKVSGVYYYGKELCGNVNEAYIRFRNDYNRSKGRNTRKYLQHLIPREERVHDKGTVFSDQSLLRQFADQKIDCYFMGLVEGSYIKLVGVPDSIDEDDIPDWVDWIFREGGDSLRVIGRNMKLGRTGAGRKNIKRK